MKKRIRNILLAITILCCLFSTVALAEDITTPTNYDLFIGGEQFASNNLEIEGDTGTATYDPDTNTITLDHYSYTGEGDFYNTAVLYSSVTEPLNVVLAGENTFFNTSSYDAALNEGYGYGIRVIGNLNISGDGSLAVTAKTTGIEVTGSLAVSSDLYIDIKTDCGIDADAVEITGGKTEIAADVNGGDYGYIPYGICAYNDLILTDGELTVSAEYGCGVDAYSVDISGGVFDITAYYDALYAGDTLSITNGEGTVESIDESAIHAKDDITVSGAKLTLTANQYGIYTNKAKAPVHIADKSEVTITAAGRGIYTSKDESGITVNDSQVTVTVDNGEYSSDEGICTKGVESPIVIENSSAVNISTKDDGIRTDEEDSDITVSASDVTADSAYGNGLRASEKSSGVFIDQSKINITAAGIGISANKKYSDISILDRSEVTVTITENEYADSALYAYNALSVMDSTVKVTSASEVYSAVYAGEDITIGVDDTDASFVTVVAASDRALETYDGIYIDGDKTKVVLTSGAEDANGVACQALEMTGGWLNNNGNHTFYSDFELAETLLIAEDRLLTIKDSVSLNLKATLTNHGTIENSGTLTILNKNGLIGNGTAGGTGAFRIAEYVDADVNVPEDLIYNGEDQTPAAAGAISLPATIEIQSAEFTYPDADGWTRTITPSQVKHAGTYTALYTKGEKELEKAFHISQKEIEIIGVAVSDKVYDGTSVAAVSSITFSGIVAGESLVFGEDYAIQAAFPDINADSEAQTVTVSVVLTDSEAASNYTLTNGSRFEAQAAAKITPKLIKITADHKEAFVGNRKPELTYTVTGLVGSDKLSKVPALTTDANMNAIGTYDVILSGADAGENYHISYEKGTLTVKVRAITVPVADDTVFVYNGSEQTYGISNTDAYSISGGKQTNAGTYTVTVMLTDKVNTVWADTGDTANKEYSFVIQKAALIVTAEDKEANVGGRQPELTYTVTGLVGSDKLTEEPSLTTNADMKTLGTYGITAAGADAGGNYTITYQDGTLTVNPWPVCPEDESCPMYSYTDLNSGKWYHDGVHYTIENGLMQGIGNKLFDPNGTSTRAMVVTILWRMEGEPVCAQGKNGTFADVPEHTWYTEAVEWASANEIVLGYNGNFFPGDPITREQLVTILWRYAKYKGCDVSEETDLRSFRDADEISQYAIPAMQWACGADILQGIGKDGSIHLDPQGAAARSQIATVLMRFDRTVL